VIAKGLPDLNGYQRFTYPTGSPVPHAPLNGKNSIMIPLMIPETVVKSEKARGAGCKDPVGVLQRARVNRQILPTRAQVPACAPGPALVRLAATSASSCPSSSDQARRSRLPCLCH
jgi:hypothetical protein